MELDTLRDADFKLLDDAVKDWSTLVKNLETLKKDAEDNLRKGANKADWAGVNAKVSKEFIGKTAGEFADAHTQATTIHKILNDTVGELKGYHRQLVEAIDGGRKKSLKVIGYEGGFTVTTDVPPEARHTMDQDNQSDITALRDRIQGILNKATESDDSARTVLQAIADQSKLGFSDSSYRDRDSAAEAIKQADELAALAKKNPDDLSVKDFDRLNAGLKKYAGDELFAERFATTLGPKKTLEFWTGVTDPQRGNWELGRERLDQFDDLQRSLGMTLANATQSDSTAMADWKRTMIDIGDKPLYGNRGGPMGFQVMSNLMRTGDYDDRFLTDYGTKLMATERKLTGNGEHRNLAWLNSVMTPRLNRIGEDSGADPLTGYLKGLSNSPDAATDFFNQRFISKDDPGNPFERDTDGNGKNGKVSLSNFQYLFEEREWPKEMNSKGDDLHTGQNNLALALEAATTGHPAGELPTLDTPAHNAGQTKLFESLVASVSDNAERLTKNGYMSDSIGQIASEYLPDINRAATDVDPHPDKDDVDAQQAWDRIKNTYPIAGSAAEMNHRDISRFLFTIGQNPEGYAAVEVGQKKYMTYLMDHHLNPDLPESRRPHHDEELTVRSIARHSGEVSGTLAMGRNEAVASGAVESDEKYDHSVAQWKNTASGAIGLGVGVGTSFIASPVAGAVAAGAAGTVTSVVMEQFFKDAEGSAKDGAGSKMGENWEKGQDGNMKYTRRAASEAARAHGHATPGDVASWAEDESFKGYLSAGGHMERVAPELVTDI
ncbi:MULTISPECIES: DUF6571 family protein [Streptomyces]|uniref:WXG100 family type VII secretion target n=1 Tax=Streptomyces prasinus TaxID=67345 RepID=A0ABX6B0I1_9ACTN|nr:DUF6571 family protein [Streptomyces prasinus]QEV08606.1 hypothetical protein CP972_25865 [Streptomyces prasinus]